MLSFSYCGGHENALFTSAAGNIIDPLPNFCPSGANSAVALKPSVGCKGWCWFGSFGLARPLSEWHCSLRRLLAVYLSRHHTCIAL